MTQLIEKEIKELVKEDLKNNPENFWEDLFNAVDHYVGVYIERLEKQGVDLDYLEYKLKKSIGAAPLEGLSLKEKVGSLISPLERVISELNYTYLKEKKKKKSIEDLNKDIQEKENEIKKLQIEKENLEAISKATESEMAMVKDQTLYDLEEEMKDIRAFLTRLPADIKSLEDHGDVIPDKFKKRMDRGIQVTYKILQEAKLWQYDAKPEEIKFNKLERRASRNHTKENEENETVELESTQNEQEQIKQLSEEKVTIETMDNKNTLSLKDNTDQQTLLKDTKHVKRDVKEKVNLPDEKSSEELHNQSSSDKNTKKDIHPKAEMEIEVSSTQNEDDRPLYEQNDEDQNLEDQGKSTEFMRKQNGKIKGSRED